MSDLALEVSHLTKTFRLHREKTNSLKALVASRGRRNVYEDFVALGGWKGAKEKGAVRSEGKEYVVQDGDVLLFRFNV